MLKLVCVKEGVGGCLCVVIVERKDISVISFQFVYLELFLNFGGFDYFIICLNSDDLMLSMCTDCRKKRDSEISDRRTVGVECDKGMDRGNIRKGVDNFHVGADTAVLAI
ncbi:hypothetical protein CEXT_399491 [Caerostris extrusa]|uniref:Uncharacterized protein n=1 Tax=Caerostris extrusa TaxID=172846 RepID=A0AAV4Y3A2_CAEEX|nr:hypothetical protein CEXT_399491 [Caerostris extrusa]